MVFFDSHSADTVTVSSNFTGSTLNISLSEYRQELSDQTAITLLPALVYLGILMLVGFVGNGLVFNIYLRKIADSSTRPIILALACFDLITCVVSIPGEMLDIRYSFNFPSNGLCKFFRLSTTLLLIASGMTLLLVALDRYNRICHPMRNQVTVSTTWLRVAGACFVACVLALLAPLVNATREIETPTPGVMGVECSTNPAYSKVVIGYYIMLGAVFLSAFAIMILLYILIGRRVLRQNKFRIDNQRRRPSKATTDEYPSNFKECNDQAVHEESSVSGNVKGDYFSGSNDKSLEKEEEEGHMMNAVKDVCASRASNLHRKLSSLAHKPTVFRKLRSNSLDAYARRTTLMLFLLTLMFVISFLPHLVISVMQTTTKNLHTHDTSSTVNNVYNIFVRSYFLNTAANPFIYGFCNHKFRRECKKLILSCAFWSK